KHIGALISANELLAAEMAAEDDAIGYPELRRELLDFLHPRPETHEAKLDVVRLHRSHGVQRVLEPFPLDQPCDADHPDNVLRWPRLRRPEAARAHAVGDHVD